MSREADEAALELDYLQELLETFGVSGPPPTLETFRTLKERFEHLLRIEIEDVVGGSPTSTGSLVSLREPADYVALVLRYHRDLYDGILVNAGQFRQATDPDGGGVFFGGSSGIRMKEKFSGSAPDRIEADLLGGFRLLFDGGDPIRASVLAYHRFQCVHPFYDANGRIGRVFVTRYLAAHDLWIEWDRIVGPERTRFYQRLNKAHGPVKRGRPHTGYDELLYLFWKDFVIPLPGPEDEPYDEAEEETNPQAPSRGFYRRLRRVLARRRPKS